MRAGRENASTRPAWARRARRTLTAVGVTLALYAILGFLVVPFVARRIGQTKLSELLHRQVQIDEVRVNPFVLPATIRDVRISDRHGKRDLFSLRERSTSTPSSPASTRTA